MPLRVEPLKLESSHNPLAYNGVWNFARPEDKTYKLAAKHSGPEEYHASERATVLRTKLGL
jgi:hypothetical protein